MGLKEQIKIVTKKEVVQNSNEPKGIQIACLMQKTS